MLVKIDLVDEIEETEVKIRCNKIDDEIIRLKKIIEDSAKPKYDISLFKDNKEYYFSLKNILFFETDGNNIYAHTINDAYLVKRKLYELEELLPDDFLRVSKSTILNINQILSVTRNFPSANLVEFNKSHKQVYVSRYYYKYLDVLLKERKKL